VIYLATALDGAIAGDEDPVAVNQRSWMRPVWESPTAAERLRAYASAVRRIHASAGTMFHVVAVASSADADADADAAELADLADLAEDLRRRGATSIIDPVRRVGQLAPGLSRARAIDILTLLTSPAPFQHLVRRCGWTLDRYERWLADTMISQLLHR
jgi:hypothetical protein